MASPFNPKAVLRVRAKYEKMEEKSQMVKRNWFRKNYERVYLNPSLPQDKIPKKAAVLFNAFLELERVADEERENKLKKKKVEEPIQEVEEEPLTPAELLARGPMYPVHPEIKQVLYEGISHNDEGRRHYLKLRNKSGIRLEDKFYSPLTYTQGIGWMVQERFIPAVRYGRREIIKRNFPRRNGALKGDSLYWRGPQMETFTVCTI